MRDINRIDRILDKIKKLWMKFPDQRLGQLLDNYMFGYKLDSHIFYVEDDIAEERLDEIFEFNLLERLAELEHLQWSHWTRHFLEFDNTENRKMWKTQAHFLYVHLSEQEKEHNRKWARKVLEILNEK